MDYLLVDGQMDSAADPRGKLSRLPIPPTTVPRLLTEAETKHVRAAPDGDSVMDLRDRSILGLLYAAGLRAGEVCRLTVPSIDGEGEILRVVGKGGSERRVPLHPLASETLHAYLAECPAEPRACEALVVSKKRGLLTVRAVEFLVARHAEAAGLDRHVHPHVLRHARAIHLLRHGASPEAIRKRLDHPSLASTPRSLPAPGSGGRAGGPGVPPD
ncbi:MAG: tyrosine-type recombinase/integrase [Clostridia bacterium]